MDGEGRSAIEAQAGAESLWKLRGRFRMVEGLGHLEEALSGGSGAILATTHFGHGRLIKPVLGIHGWPPLLVAGDDSGQRPPIAAPDLPTTLNPRPHLAALRETGL